MNVQTRVSVPLLCARHNQGVPAAGRRHEVCVQTVAFVLTKFRRITLSAGMPHHHLMNVDGHEG